MQDSDSASASHGPPSRGASSDDVSPQHVSATERLRYAFDNTLAGGPLGLVIWLAIFTGLLIAVLTVLLYFAGLAPGHGLGELAFMSFQQTLEPTAFDNSLAPPVFTAMVVAAIVGLLVTSTLVGVVTTGIQNRLEGLREGRSMVVESGHTLILGWAERIFPILTELVEANANQKDCCVVVLGDAERSEMERRIAERVDDCRTTRIVCRSGSPIDPGDLKIANVHRAKAVIILADDGDDADINVIKSLLAILNSPDRRKNPFHVVAPINDPQNLAVIEIVGREEVELLLVDDVIARIMAQTSLQPGLSAIYQDLLDFAGDEIYVVASADLPGRQFRDVLHCYESSTVIGIARGNRVMLCPPMDTVFGADDAAIVITADDDTAVFRPHAPDIDASLIASVPATSRDSERILMFGWNRSSSATVRELERYVAPGSYLRIVSSHLGANGAEEVLADLNNLEVDLHEADPTNRALLESERPWSYDHAILMADGDRSAPQTADARTLMTLLHVRDIVGDRGSHLPVVTEMLDPRNRELASATQADDFIVSDRLISLLLAQVAENKQLNEIFKELFSARGCEIYIRPAGDYVALDRPIDYHLVVEAAIRKGQIALGYRLAEAALDPSRRFGVVLNPVKADRVQFGPEDSVVVLAH